jgi:enterobactin synthetase component D
MIGIGIDSETVVDQGGFDAIMSGCFSDNERELILLQDTPKVAATLFFSAKESFYKAIFGTVKRFVEFHEAKIESICWATHVLTIKVISKDLAITHYPVVAQFLIADNEVHTSVALYS